MDGVWRTIKGRRVFIKNGETPTEAIKRNEKEKQEEENKKAKSKISELSYDIDENIKFDGQSLKNEEGKVNEVIALIGTNPNNYYTNCQVCPVTFVERLKGNDVIAKEKDSLVSKDWYKYWEGVNSLDDWERVYSTTSSGTRQIGKEIKEAGDGAIFEIYFQYNKKSGIEGKAHVFVGMNKNDKVLFLDSQSTNTNSAINKMEYLTQYSIWGQTRYLRIDDKNIKEEYKDKLFYERTKDETK